MCEEEESLAYAIRALETIAEDRCGDTSAAAWAKECLAGLAGEGGG